MTKTKEQEPETESETKSQTITFRLRPSELNELLRRKEESGLTLRDFIVKKCIGKVEA